MNKNKIAVIGLGYVGLPVSVLFSTKYKVIGYDINVERIKSLNNFNDTTEELSSKDIKKALKKNLSFSNDRDSISDCNIYIITVPTPIDKNKKPDLSLLYNASKLVGEFLKAGDIVIYESTVYPGCTEEFCVPVLEKVSNLKYNDDFYCGYSPERINPGDKNHTIEKITKVTSGSTIDIAKKIDSLYSSVIKAGTFMASSIKVAEAAKVIENSQRDINIAFINELSKIFKNMEIDTNEVLDAASTKWNFLNFRPGLVGGHCIGVDPFYLADKSILLGYTPKVILAGREINDSMGEFIADDVIKSLKNRFSNLIGLKILILGATFKENCPDFRNTKVLDIVNKLKSSKLEIDIYDPWVDQTSFLIEYDQNVLSNIPKQKYNAIILAVSHDIFKNLNLNKLKEDTNTIIYDIKGFFNKELVDKRL